MTNDIRMENFYWRCQKQGEQAEVEDLKKKRQRQRNARWMKWARRILMVELAVILFEGMYRFGYAIRGYNSFGGESMVILALIGFSAWKLKDILK